MSAVTDEEEQQALIAQISNLQNEVRDLKNKTDQTKQENDLLKNEIQKLNLNNNAQASPPTNAATEALTADKMQGNALPPDTFTLMMASPLKSTAWILGLSTFAIQMIVTLILVTNQIGSSNLSSLFDIPFKVSSEVRALQFLFLILTLALQNDVASSVRTAVMLRGSSSQGLVHIILPNVLKFGQGGLMMFITFVAIVQSDNAFDMLQIFVTLMLLSTTDNVFYALARHGYLGLALQRKAVETGNIKVQWDEEVTDSVADLETSVSRSMVGKGFRVSLITQLCLAIAMIGGWLFVVANQVNGTFFIQKYPQCNFTGSFELNKVHFGDGLCFGGPLNTLECEFEGGDCVDFNIAYPLCKGDDRVNVQYRLGDGLCDMDLNDADCAFDGWDCCPYDVFNDESFGDGQCNGGVMNTMGCLLDNGDCEDFFMDFPNCPIDALSRMNGSSNVVLGDGVCDSEIYNIEECGYEFGDCIGNN